MKLQFECFSLGRVEWERAILIRLLTEYIRNFYSHDALLLCAPSGVAAFNIGGSTCHRAFGLAVEHGSVPAYNRLSSQTLARYRQTYKNLKFVILDECSLVNYETLRMISLRLGEIFNNDEAFGGRFATISAANGPLDFRPACQLPGRG